MLENRSFCHSFLPRSSNKSAFKQPQRLEHSGFQIVPITDVQPIKRVGSEPQGTQEAGVVQASSRGGSGLQRVAAGGTELHGQGLRYLWV